MGSPTFEALLDNVCGSTRLWCRQRLDICSEGSMTPIDGSQHRHQSDHLDDCRITDHVSGLSNQWSVYLPWLAIKGESKALGFGSESRRFEFGVANESEKLDAFVPGQCWPRRRKMSPGSVVCINEI